MVNLDVRSATIRFLAAAGVATLLAAAVAPDSTDSTTAAQQSALLKKRLARASKMDERMPEDKAFAKLIAKASIEENELIEKVYAHAFWNELVRNEGESNKPWWCDRKVDEIHSIGGTWYLSRNGDLETHRRLMELFTELNASRVAKNKEPRTLDEFIDWQIPDPHVAVTFPKPARHPDGTDYTRLEIIQAMLGAMDAFMENERPAVK